MKLRPISSIKKQYYNRLSNYLSAIALLTLSLHMISLNAAPMRVDLSAIPIGEVGGFEPSKKRVGLSADYLNFSGEDNEDYDIIDVFRPWFDISSMQGDLIQYALSKEAVLNTDVNLNISEAPMRPQSGANWSASEKLNKMNWINRKIFFKKNKNQKPFIWSEISQYHDVLSCGKKGVDFIKGDQSNEKAQGGEFRNRDSILGSIIRSTPTYIKNPREWYLFNDYVNFAIEHKDRDPGVIVGANDGMVHMFDPETGAEKWAYIPSAVIKNLCKLTGNQHTYFVDGQIAVKDAYIPESELLKSK